MPTFRAHFGERPEPPLNKDCIPNVRNKKREISNVSQDLLSSSPVAHGAFTTRRHFGLTHLLWRTCNATVFLLAVSPPSPVGKCASFAQERPSFLTATLTATRVDNSHPRWTSVDRASDVTGVERRAWTAMDVGDMILSPVRLPFRHPHPRSRCSYRLLTLCVQLRCRT